MSAVHALVNPRRIKAAHRRRRKVASALWNYQHTDALGSPVAVTDANRNVIETNEYEPFGKVINHPLKDGPGYTGHVGDAATGMINMQERYYDPDIGRSNSVDPVTVFDSGDWRFFNRYAHAFNNPYRFTDPDGRAPMEAGRPQMCENLPVALPRTEITSPTWSGVVTSGYGNRIHPVTGQAKLHNGTDFRAPLNARIRSTQDGTVASVNNSGGPGGNQIMVNNDDGSLSGYAHTAPGKGIEPGAKVSSGTILGKSDGSGRITGPHLHYTYRPGTTEAPATVQTKPVDPVKTQLKDVVERKK